MTLTINKLVHDLQAVFGGAAQLLARQTGFVKRKSPLTGSIFAQTLVFGWLQNPRATLEELAQVAAHLGASISGQSLDKRFSMRAAVFMERLLQEAVLRVVSADAVAVPVLRRFAGVSVLDSTTLSLPPELAGNFPGTGKDGAKNEAGLKVQVRLDLVDGTLNGPFVHSANTADQKGKLQTAALQPGTLRLADLGFFSLESLARMHSQGVYWLTRLKFGTRMCDAQEKPLSLVGFLKQQTLSSVEVPITLGPRERMPCRLLAWRVPAEVAATRRRRLREQARRGKKFNQQRWDLADWNYYVTNASGELLSLSDAQVLARCRWQIELLFKLWKSEGHVDKSRSHKPERILCETYAKLLGMVVQHWLLLTTCWSHPDRSLVKASRTVRLHAVALAVALEHGHVVCALLLTMKQCLAKGCRVTRRRRAPPTHELLRRLSEAA